MQKTHFEIIGTCFFVMGLCSGAFCQQPQAPAEPPAQEQSVQKQADAQGAAVIGQIFNVPVPLGNYLFVKSTLMVFGNRWGAQPKETREWEDTIWEQLVLSFEAFRRNIQVSDQEIEEEIDRSLKGEKVSFDWRKDKEAFAKWVKEKTNEPVELFQGQIRHILQLQKLRDQVRDSINPSVPEKEAYQQFLNENNHLDLELVQFSDERQAQDFFRQAKRNKKFWEEQKAKNSKEFKHPGFVTLIFLADIWKIPQDALDRMLKLSAGTVYQPAPIYKGYAVFKVLGKRVAEESLFAKSRYGYHDKVALKKKYEGLNDWIRQLKQDANIKILKQGG